MRILYLLCPFLLLLAGYPASAAGVLAPAHEAEIAKRLSGQKWIVEDASSPYAIGGVLEFLGDNSGQQLLAARFNDGCNLDTASLAYQGNRAFATVGTHQTLSSCAPTAGDELASLRAAIIEVLLDQFTVEMETEEMVTLYSLDGMERIQLERASLP